MKQQLRNTEGFTLLELLIVIAIVSILSAIAVPQLNAYKRNAFIDEVKIDLKNASLFQEAYFIDNDTYTGSVGTLNSAGFRQNAQVVLSITVGMGGQSFSISATHNNCGADTWTLNISGQVIDPVTPCE